ncbi:hypothetical protein LINGRAHAP2_LOCUS25438, partial [Linum grandiflorum]
GRKNIRSVIQLLIIFLFDFSGIAPPLTSSSLSYVSSS